MVRVFLAEDMHMVRGALVALLNMDPDIEVVGETATGADILAQVRVLEPDVAVIDIDLPEVDGLTVAAQIRDEDLKVRTLMLTSLGSPGTLRRALAAKVDGFLLKDAPPSQLAKAIRDVAAGQRVIDGQLALAAWDRGECPLTSRELDVLRMAAGGADPGEIAKALFLSAGTVRNYLTTIIAKLNARNRVDAIRICVDAGWF